MRKTLVLDALEDRQPRPPRRRRRLRHGRPVLPAGAVVRDGRAAARRPAAPRQRQQLPGQRGTGRGHARRHGDGARRPASGARTPTPATSRSSAHRGASGYRPEHTLASYELAILQCADYIEPDLVSTKDGVLVARHENEIGGTTDVAAHPEFADRRTTKTIDGRAVTGWFTEDFTLAELQDAARQGAAALRCGRRTPRSTGSTRSRRSTRCSTSPATRVTCDGRPVGVYPETKHPTYFDSIGLSLEEPLRRPARARTASTTARARSSSRASRRATCASSTAMTDVPTWPSWSTAPARRTTSWPPVTRAPTPTW